MNGLGKMLLPDLITSFFEKIVDKGYSDLYTYTLKLVAGKLQRYAQGIGEEYMTPELASAFLRELYADVTIYTKRHVGHLATLLLQFEKTGGIPQNRLKSSVFPVELSPAFEGYLESQRERLREVSLGNYRYLLVQTAKYLSNVGVQDISAVTQDVIVHYTSSLSRYSGKSANMVLHLFSEVLKYAFKQGMTEVDASQWCMKVRYYDGEKIPSTFTKEEIERTLLAIDRSTSLGKRDYAMLMLVSRTGLRCSDVTNLKFENIRFDTDSIDITQSKTGKMLALPMTEEIGLALIDYLKNGRPDSDSKHIFLQISAPHAPVKGPLNAQVGKYMAYAGIENYAERNPGYQALRHSLASNMLKNNTSLYQIKEYLGHESTDTTMRYIKIDHAALRQCALDVPPIRH